MISYPVRYSELNLAPHELTQHLLMGENYEFRNLGMKASFIESVIAEDGTRIEVNVYPLDEVSKQIIELLDATKCAVKKPVKEKGYITGLVQMFSIIRLLDAFEFKKSIETQMQNGSDFKTAINERLCFELDQDFNWLIDSLFVEKNMRGFDELVWLLARLYFNLVDYPLVELQFDTAQPFPNIDPRKYFNHTFSEGIIGYYYVANEFEVENYSVDALFVQPSTSQLLDIIKDFPLPVENDLVKKYFELFQEKLTEVRRIYEANKNNRTFALINSRTILDVNSHQTIELTETQEVLFQKFINQSGITGDQSIGTDSSKRKNRERLQKKLSDRFQVELITEIAKNGRIKTYGLNPKCRLFQL